MKKFLAIGDFVGIPQFLKDGVPDWCLEHFPELYQDLVSNEEFLKTHGLDAAQIKILQNAVRKVETLCQELSNYRYSPEQLHPVIRISNLLCSNRVSVS